MGTSRSRFVQVTNKLIDKDISNQVLHDKEIAKLDTLHKEEVTKLKSQLYDLKNQLNIKDKHLELRTKQLQEEQQKNISLLFCDLPLQLLDCDPSDTSSYTKLNKNYTMITIAKCDVVGFDNLSLQPNEAVLLIDQIQAIIDESFKSDDIFIMERFSDGCIVACGLIDSTSNTCSKTAVSSISQTPLDTPQGNPPAIAASTLANAVLKLMSLSKGIKICQRQLQLRVAIHSGSCTGGVVNVQTTLGTHHIPHFKLFGPAVSLTNKLCSTSLALQIRVSKTSWELLNDIGGYQFERCPDYMTWNGQKPLESYWLVGHRDLNYDLPLIHEAISLSEY